MDGLTSMAEWRRDRAGGMGAPPPANSLVPATLRSPSPMMLLQGGGGAGGKRKALWFWKVSLELSSGSGGGWC